MRRALLILAVLVIVPSIGFAQVGIGAAGYLKSPVLIGQPVSIDELNVNQFSFGGDVRFRLGWFQAEGLMLYSLGSVNSLDLFLDAGVALDIGILALSFGVGPNFTNNFGQSPPAQVGLNAKAGADVRIGPISIGASYIMSLDLQDGINIDASSGLLGLQILFWL